MGKKSKLSIHDYEACVLRGKEKYLRALEIFVETPGAPVPPSESKWIALEIKRAEES